MTLSFAGGVPVHEMVRKSGFQTAPAGGVPTNGGSDAGSKFEMS